MGKDKKTKNVVTTHGTLPDGFFDDDVDAQLEFVDQLLRGMSPNPRVRATAARKADQQRKPK